MTGKTHFCCGMAAAMYLCTDMNEAALLALGSLLPDIDNSRSMLGRFIPFVQNIFGHRTLTHSLAFIAILYFINPFLAMGGMMHLVLDMMTMGGCPLLYPYGKRFRFPLAKYATTGGAFETFMFCLLVGLIMYRIFIMVQAQGNIDNLLDVLT